MKTTNPKYNWTNKDIDELVEAVKTVETPRRFISTMDQPVSREFMNKLTFTDRCDKCGSVELVADIQLCWQCLDDFPVYEARYTEEDTEELS